MPLFDYFRAPDADAVQRVMSASDGCSPMGEVFDGVDAKGIDPTVVLGMMVAAIRKVPWSPDLVEQKLVWPPGGEQDLDHEGPWVAELNASARDVLAEAGDLPRVAQEWARIEELGGHLDVRDAQAFIETMVGLAGRAREADELLYCWMSL
ncbi:hypothetical protein [Amycolatopsis sp. DG1A-15b]|uniref:hypothetical protein n=1 Tax=Amycolatopsis sp. DG1A-15b TaxID=3052846 RepID=UPI00255BF990|nr:hypothetical protein [Amycolatopsis sp. DG1A-15b]WIX89642.1 hypothetical protein QRY02_04110 [Amycolatopsis sp. DG1A-15b]